MEVVNLQTQKSIAKLTYAVVDTRTVDLSPFIFELFKLCGSELLFHVQTVFISLISSAVHQVHISLTFYFLPLFPLNREASFQ